MLCMTKDLIFHARCHGEHLTEPLRLAVWNTAGAFHRKAHVVEGFDADIAVLSEVGADFRDHLQDSTSGVWIGREGGRGVAVVGFGGWQIELGRPPVKERLFLPAVATRGDTTLQIVGVCVQRDGDYVGPTKRALATLSDFIADATTIIAGDFNQTVRLDPGRGPARQFREVLDQLSALGMRSAWHSLHGQEFGAEIAATHYWRWQKQNPFHIDYAFARESMRVSSATLGTYEDYTDTRISDHVPLLIDIEVPRNDQVRP